MPHCNRTPSLTIHVMSMTLRLHEGRLQISKYDDFFKHLRPGPLKIKVTQLHVIDIYPLGFTKPHGQEFPARYGIDRIEVLSKGIGVFDFTVGNRIVVIEC